MLRPRNFYQWKFHGLASNLQRMLRCQPFSFSMTSIQHLETRNINIGEVQVGTTLCKLPLKDSMSVLVHFLFRLNPKCSVRGFIGVEVKYCKCW